MLPDLVELELVVLEEARETEFSRIIEPPLDSEGVVFELFDGALPPVGRRLYLIKTDDKPLPDLLFSIGRTLIASRRAWDFMESADTGGAKAHDVIILDLSGNMLGCYFWINFVHKYSVMDRERSEFSLSKRGIFTSIDSFRVKDGSVPSHGVFREDSVGMIIFHREIAERALRRGYSGGRWCPLIDFSWP